ncbi:MAG: hypothetical protein P9L92_17700 [Candidatus Electryonea clarkiae]|nr:hypothetical protein [Candidatus Electryonea clarkiae]
MSSTSGWYRIVYAIDDQEKSVLVVKVGYRKDVYKYTFEKPR